MRGFTLIEMLLAIAVTVVVSGATAHLVFQFVETRSRTEPALLRVEQWQRLADRFNDDLSTYAPLRNVRTQDGAEPALRVTAEPVIQLTRLGWSRPAYQPPHRSELQRVRYRLADWNDPACAALRARYRDPGDVQEDSECLVRQYSRHLDRLADAVWESQPLAGPLDSMAVVVTVSDAGEQQTDRSEWPTSGNSGAPETDQLPVMLTLTLVYSGETDSPVHLSGALTGYRPDDPDSTDNGTPGS